jgi:hypothetical protein
MSNIEVDSKNDWILIALLAAAIVFICIGLEGCTTTKYYPYKVTFNDGSVEYYELTYKVRKDSKAIEYNGETILGVDSVELIK